MPFLIWFGFKGRRVSAFCLMKSDTPHLFFFLLLLLLLSCLVTFLLQYLYRACVLLYFTMTGFHKIIKLADQVNDSRCHGPEGKGTDYFLPQDKLDDLSNKHTVQEALKDAGIEANEIPALVDYVCKGPARRLFLILVMMTRTSAEKVSILKHLRRSGVHDGVLPIGFYGREHPGLEGHGYCLESAERGPSNSFGLFVDGTFDWDRHDCTAFESYQWLFLTPVFGGPRFRFRALSRMRVLPYLTVSQKPVAAGFFGEVLEAKALAAHFLNLPKEPGSDTVLVAIKKAQEGDGIADIFNDEADNLERVLRYKSPHLIKPIAAYDHGEDKCLLFPWARGGNLRSYWKEHEADAATPEGLCWIIYRFVGICSAMEELHEDNCRHGDLKPQNILWFHDVSGGTGRGTLQIADLGLTTFHEKGLDTQDRKEMQLYTKSLSGTRRYEPPEMDASRGMRTNEVRSREYDIWSMGCILLELLIWLVYGFETLHRFEESTEHFWAQRPKKGEYTLLPDVHTYIETLAMGLASPEAAQGSPLYRELLELVRLRLLVVPCSDEYDGYEGKREIARVLHERVRHVHDRYCTPDVVPIRLRYPTPGNSSLRPHEGGNPSPNPNLNSMLVPPQLILRHATGEMNTGSQLEDSGLLTVQPSDHQQVRLTSPTCVFFFLDCLLTIYLPC